LLGQPQTTVEADIDAERIPGLEADVATAHHWVFVVVIEVKTFALLTNRLEPFAIPSSTHGHGQAEPTVEADIDAERIPGLEADVTTAHDGVFVVVIEVKTFALFAYGLEPSPVSGAANGHSQARLDRAEHGDEAAFDLVALSNVLNELLLAGLSGTQEMVRPLGGGRDLLRFLEEAVSQRLGVLGKVNQPDFGGTQIRTHPLRGKQRTEAGVEAKAIPATQGALDQRTKLVHKAFGNEVFR